MSLRGGAVILQGGAVILRGGAMSNARGRRPRTKAHPVSGEALMIFALLTVGALTPAAEAANLVPNPSMETPATGDPGRPEGWSQDSWGEVTASFDYLQSGYQGSRSARVALTARGAEGDAKWWSAPFDVPAGGGRFEVGDAYRASGQSELLVLALGAAGESEWLPVKVLAPVSVWTEITAQVDLPAWATQVRLAHVLAVVGWLETDSYQMEPAAGSSDGGLPRDGATADGGTHTDAGGPSPGPPLVSVVFDDGWLSSYLHAVPVMAELGLRGSHYIVTGWVDKPGYQSDYMISEQILELALAGHEIGSHALYHDNLTELSNEDLQRYIVGSKATLEGLGLEVAGFVPPGGAVDERGIKLAREHYSYLRTVKGGLNTVPYDRYDLRCVVVLNTTPLSEIATWVEQARAERSWLILLYHRFTPDAPLDTMVTPQRFREDMELLVTAGASVLPIGEVLGVWTRPEPPPPVETGKLLPRPDLGLDDGCAAAGTPAHFPEVFIILVIFCTLGLVFRKKHP